jgi:hypothetical protein
MSIALDRLSMVESYASRRSLLARRRFSFAVFKPSKSWAFSIASAVWPANVLKKFIHSSSGDNGE